MDTKPWYVSKTIWSDVATIIMAALPAVDSQFHTHIVGSPAYAAILALLGGLGIYGRTTANTSIGGN